jgi:hypothetical protein
MFYRYSGFQLRQYVKGYSAIKNYSCKSSSKKGRSVTILGTESIPSIREGNILTFWVVRVIIVHIVPLKNEKISSLLAINATDTNGTKQEKETAGRNEGPK